MTVSREEMLAPESAALVALAEHGIPCDIQSLLVQGSKRQGVPPGALRKALTAALRAAAELDHRTKDRPPHQIVIEDDAAPEQAAQGDVAETAAKHK